MKSIAQRFVSTIALVTVLASITACSTTEGVAQEEAFRTPDGVAIVDTFTTAATVTAINATTRKVTMTTPDGKSGTYKAAAGVDLAQFQVGEQIGVQVMNETLLSIGHDGAPARDSVATSFAAAADDSGSATFEGEAVEVSAKIIAVDAKARSVTLQLADGTTKTLKAHGSADLSQVAVGSTVVVKYAVAVVVAVANA